jgi:hypothetical protein
VKDFDAKAALNNILTRYQFPERYFSDFILDQLKNADRMLKQNELPKFEFPTTLREMLFKL